MEKMKILIDTDLGDDVDDAAALMLALKYPGFDIVGITTVYKDTGKRKEMVEDLLRRWNRTDIPVHMGRGRALLEAAEGETEEPIQYALLAQDGAERRAASETAVDFILEMAREEPELVILEMGCMTNLAQAF